MVDGNEAFAAAGLGERLDEIAYLYRWFVHGSSLESTRLEHHPSMSQLGHDIRHGHQRGLTIRTC
ncbi:hypothetical protein JCM18916_1342 [Cutibacterium acnes JCM 18916]|nr:hypothetical protein JCM18916_1342 [Cutibacterium acnes JCM 18916]GAE77913.1 hypothetical protein JCM18918_3837 [Cutibacterium acnes JCM 18918]